MGKITMLTVALVIVGCATALADDPRIEVSAEATTIVRPDQAAMQVTVTAVAKDTEQVLGELKRRVAAARELLKHYKLKDGEVRRSETEVNANVSHIAKKVVKEGYYAKLRLAFTLLDLKQHEDLSAKLSELEGVEFGKPDYGRTDADDLRKQNLKKALANARAKAEHMAQVLGVKLGSPVYARETASYYGRQEQRGVNIILNLGNEDPFAEPESNHSVDRLDNVVFVSEVTVHFGIKKE